MTRLVLSFVLSLYLAVPAFAQEGDVQATIGAQIEAFLEDDFDRAFTFASPAIRDIFRTPQNFGEMVRKGYPMVWRPSDVQYLQFAQDGKRALQRIQITDARGNVHLLEYQLIMLENAWKINGVVLLESSSVAA